jgi:hypothetical protein
MPAERLPLVERGLWEAPRWTFFVAIAAILVVSGLYAARRSGLLRFRRPQGGSR